MIHLLDQLTKLAESGRKLAEVTDLDELYENVFDLVAAIFDNQTAAILLRNPKDGTLSIVASRGYDPEVVKNFKVAPGQGVTGYVLQTGESQLVTETVNDPRYICGVTKALSEIACPLISGNDVIGVLDMESADHRFTTADQAMFVTLGDQVVTAIRSMQLQASLEERARKLVSIAKVGQSLIQEPDLDKLLERVVDSVHEALRLDTSAIMMWDKTRENMVVVNARGYDRDVTGLTVARGTGVTGKVAQERKPCIIEDVTKIQNYIPGLEGCRSEMAVPLLFQGEVIGILNVEHREVNRFDETDLLHATIFADQAASAIANARDRKDLTETKLKVEQLSTKLGLLAKTSARLTSISNLDTLLDRILSLARDILGFGQIALLLPEPSGLHLKVSKSAGFDAGTEGRLIPVEGSISGAAYNTATSQFIPDVTLEPNYIGGCENARSNIAVPLIVEDDAVGVLVAETIGDEILTEVDVEVLETLASQVASVVQAARQRTDLAERSRRLTMIHRAACSLNAIEDPEEMLTTILQLAKKALGFDAVAILTPSGDGINLTVRKALDHGDVEGLKMPIGTGFVGEMFVTGKAHIIDDIELFEDYIPGTPGARCEMAVPLTLDGNTIGILDAEAMEPYAFSISDLELFRVFGSQVATALKNAGMIHDLEDRAKKLTLIHRAACSLNAIDEPDEMLDNILTLAQKALGFDAVAILTPDKDRKYLTVRRAINHGDVEGLEIPIGEGFVGEMFVTGKAHIIDDIDAFENYIPGTPGARCEMAVPLSLEGETIGILDAESMEPNSFTEEDLKLFRIFGSQAATALNNAQMIANLESRSRRLASLNQAARALNSIHNPTEILDKILETACEALGIDQCALLLANPDDDDLILHAAIGYGYALGTLVPAGEGITGRAAQTGETILINDTLKEENHIKTDAKDPARSELASPLIIMDKTIGVFYTRSPQANAFDEQDTDLFKAFAAQAAVAIQNARLIKGLEDANRLLGKTVAETNRLNKELESYSSQISDANVNLERQIGQLTALHEAGRTITASLDLDTTLHTILSMTSKIIGSTASAIKLIDVETKELRIKAEEGKMIEGSGSRAVLDLPLRIGDRTIGVFELVREAREALGDDERQMLETMASQAAIAIENARLFEDTQRVYYETLRSLAGALEARDDYTRGHSERVANMSKEIAIRLDLPEDYVDKIHNAAMLHDIGKIGIRDEVLLAPRKLTSDERTIIEQHPSFGNTILRPLKFLGDIREYVRYHHERWDGTGYPDGRKETAIPLASRIIAVADTYDAMTSTRPYRGALSVETAIDEIKNASGFQFDPSVVKVFLKIVNAS